VLHPLVPSVLLVASLALDAARTPSAPPALAPRSPAAAVRSAGRRPHAAAYRAPVDAPVRDPFRPPACGWCAGNRGLEYATAPGQPVVASAAGVVTFAGLVAGRAWVVVTHPDGLRTSYGLLAEIAVAAGAAVRSGQRLGIAGDALHFGVRRGERYLDPALVLAGAVLVPRLVPLDGGRARWPRA
jgi:murein DD-endopeptidase MepM/ murein hydrolase activator NlpD